MYSSWKIYSMFSPTYISCDYCCVTFVSLFINLRHPRDLMSHTTWRGTLCTYIWMCFFYPSAFFSLPVAGRSSCSRAPWHAGSPPGPRAQVWALAEVRGTCSGDSKSHVCSGRHSEHVEPSRPLQTHVQVKRMSDGYNVIAEILNVINVIRHYLLGDVKYFPRH